ncbi:MAG: SdrD B-like domain-containing protein [Gemmataceae bacterium]
MTVVSTPVTNQNFGDTLGNISGVVYRDYNLSCGFNPGGVNPEVGIPGITVTLRNAAGTIVATTVTDANGRYRFRDLLPGRYTVTESQPPRPTSLTNGFYDGADNLGSLGGTHPRKNALSFLLGIDPRTQLSQNARGDNFGELPPADPFGYVYHDLNKNGVRDPGELGIAGVAVTVSGTAFAGTVFARPLVASDVAPGGSLTVVTANEIRRDFQGDGAFSVLMGVPDWNRSVACCSAKSHGHG